MNTWKRAACGVLAVLMMGTTFVGCGKEEEIVVDKKVVTLPPEEQVLTDTYKQNPAIDEYMTYTTVLSSYIEHEGDEKKERVVSNLWKLFDVHTVQIDCMDLIYVGQSTMGDIVKCVDDANEAAIKYAEESVRAARQEILDKEYAAEKAKALEKGKNFTKEKPLATIDDLSYEPPYRYMLAYPNPDNKTNEQFPYIFEDYLGKNLIDPLVNKTLYLFIYKYDVPYVQCTFQNVEGKLTYNSYNSVSSTANATVDSTVRLFNDLIEQEQDWQLTAIAPADCTFLVDQELVVTPEYTLPTYVDEDWRSKGAKNNMVTNGNIKFGGEGFTWDSLMTLCNALELSMLDKDGKTWRAKTTYITNERANIYEQISDEKFTYYIINLPINYFFTQKNGDQVIPIANIIVTFNKATNLCVNWSIDYGQYYHCFPSFAKNTPDQRISVNVRTHQIDTTDYRGMLTTVDDWVKQNQTEADFGYYFVDSTGVVIGKIETGLQDYQSEVTVNGERYICTKPPMKLSDMQAQYISQSSYDKLTRDGATPSEEDVLNASQLYYIMCMAVEKDEKGRAYPLGYFNNSGVLVNELSEPSGYYIHSVDYNANTGYSNAVIIDQEVFDKLFEMYARTFRLSLTMQDRLGTLYEQNDPLQMYKYMTKYVEENENMKDKIETDVGSAVGDITNRPKEKIEAAPGYLNEAED